MKNAQEFIADVLTKRGQTLGVSDWQCFDQDDVSAHGKLTGDDGPIHSEPEWCKENTTFGGTIVQGSLLLSTFTRMAKSLDWPDGDIAFRMNYGFNRLRIINPVKTGQNFRGRFVLKDAVEKNDRAAILSVEVVLEAEGETSPALVADWLAYIQFNA